MEQYISKFGLNPSLKEKVYENLRMQIIKGTLAPGTRLPEEELSKAMNISRAPIREALNMLDMDGFARIIPRKGAFVTNITVEDIKNTWEMRELLEPYAAKSSVMFITDKEIDNLYDKLQLIIHDIESLQDYIDSDLDVHELLCKYVTNYQLKAVLQTTKAHSLRMRYYAENSTGTRKEVVQESTMEHIRILETIKERNPNKVYESVLYHIRASLVRTLGAIV